MLGDFFFGLRLTGLFSSPQTNRISDAEYQFILEKRERDRIEAVNNSLDQYRISGALNEHYRRDSATSNDGGKRK